MAVYWCAMFILDTTSGPNGMAVGMPDAKEPALVYLMAMWVHPDMRGSGAADLLVTAVLAWADAVGAHEIRLDVSESNDKAQRLYERHHFRPTGPHATDAPAMAPLKCRWGVWSM